MFKSFRVAVITVFGLSMLSAPAQAAVLFGPGESYVADFDVSADLTTPPYFGAGLEMYFDTSDWLDVVGGEGVIFEILDNSENVVGTFNSIDSFGPTPSPSLSGGFSTAFTFDQLLSDSIGSVRVSSIGSSTFLLNSIIISLFPAPPETGQTNFLYLVDNLEFEDGDVAEVPVPAAFFLFLAGLSGIFKFRKFRT